MNECLICKTARLIKTSYYAERSGKFGKVLVYVCRNPSCSEYGKEQKVFREIETRKEE